jgi:hypothetical protein
VSPSCPHCGNRRFRYGELLGLFPAREIEPTRVICPRCKSALRITAASRAVAILLVALGAFGIPLTARAYLPRPLSTSSTVTFFAVLLGYLAIVVTVAWPRLVRLRLWESYVARVPSEVTRFYVRWVLNIVIAMLLVMLAVGAWNVLRGA